MEPREVLRLRVASLDDDPTNPRQYADPAELTGLRNSVLAVGMLQPILVRSGTPGRYVIVDGHRRVAVHREIDPEGQVDALLVDPSLRAADVFLNQLVFGVMNEKLRPLDLARGIDKALKESGKSRAELGRILGMSEPTLSRKLSLLSLSPALFDAVNSGALVESAAAQLARAGGHEEQERLAAQMRERGMTRDALVGELAKRRRGDGEGRKSVPRFVAQLATARTVTLAGPGLDSVDALIELAEELLSHARKARTKGLALTTFAQLLRDQARAAGKEAS